MDAAVAAAAAAAHPRSPAAQQVSLSGTSAVRRACKRLLISLCRNTFPILHPAGVCLQGNV